MKNFTAPERETLINLCDDDELARVWTAQRPVITSLRKNPAYTEVRSGVYGTSPWAEFTIPAEQFRFGSKRRVSANTGANLRKVDLESTDA